jgi:hypothetical protein
MEERTNLMRAYHYLVEQLRKSGAQHDEALQIRLDRLSIDLVQTIEDAAVQAMGHVKGERVAVGNIPSSSAGPSVSDLLGDGQNQGG